MLGIRYLLPRENTNVYGRGMIKVRGLCRRLFNLFVTKSDEIVKFLILHNGTTVRTRA